MCLLSTISHSILHCSLTSIWSDFFIPKIYVSFDLLDVQAAAATIGFDEAKWDGDQQCYIEDTDWADLTQEQKDSVLILGYTAESWDISE